MMSRDMFKNFIWPILILWIGLFDVETVFAETASQTTVQLATGELTIPGDIQISNNAVNLIFHMHSTPAAARKTILKAEKNAVIIALHIGSFSSPYQNYFKVKHNFQKLLDEGLKYLRKHFENQQLKWGFICLSAFSGGYGGAREILRFEEYYNQIDAILLLDCPHTSYTNDGKVMPEQIDSFKRYAIDAANGNKYFIMTHSEIVPGSYASTTECADYLINAVGGEKKAWQGQNEFDMTHNRKFQEGNFYVYGFKGETAPDHMKHLHGMYLFLEQIPIPE